VEAHTVTTFPNSSFVLYSTPFLSRTALSPGFSKRTSFESSAAFFFSLSLSPYSSLCQLHEALTEPYHSRRRTEQEPSNQSSLI
jgi:hypothetical protein